MCKLSFSHQISEKRNHGKDVVNQEMNIVVKYNPEDDTVDVDRVDVYENGKFMCEISKLLDKAEGCPLATMIDEIDWREQYYQQKSEVADYDEGPVGYTMPAIEEMKSLTDNFFLNAFSHINK